MRFIAAAMLSPLLRPLAAAFMRFDAFAHAAFCFADGFFFIVYLIEL
jgi:hypothetical protein